MKTRQTRSLIVAASLVAATLLHPVAYAAGAWAQGEEPIPFRFRFDRAELTTRTGARNIYNSLMRQATRACTAMGDAGGSLRRTDTGCVVNLVEKVVRRIDAGTLSLHWKQDQMRLAANR